MGGVTYLSVHFSLVGSPACLGAKAQGRAGPVSFPVNRIIKTSKNITFSCSLCDPSGSLCVLPSKQKLSEKSFFSFLPFWCIIVNIHIVSIFHLKFTTLVFVF